MMDQLLIYLCHLFWASHTMVVYAPMCNFSLFEGITISALSGGQLAIKIVASIFIIISITFSYSN